MTTTSNKKPVIVGIFIAVGITFIVAAILSVGNLQSTFGNKISLSVVFDDVNGLKTGNNIWYSGVKIGRVEDMSFIGESKVKVHLKIEEKSQAFIKKNAHVKIGSDGLIGNRIIIIFGGTQDAASVEDGDTLHVENGISTETMMNTLQENNVNLVGITSDLKEITSKIRKSEGTLGKLLNDDELYNNLLGTISSLRKTSDHAQKIAASLSDFSDKLNNENGLINKLLTDTVTFNNISKSVSELRQVSENANAFIKTLNESMQDPNTPVGTLLHDEQTANQLKGAIKNLERSTQKLNEDLEALQHSFLMKRYFKKKEKGKL
ncbi:MAG: MlaD family protein [Bacteroidota bacterium]|jgi:phospholipid/cholesterol/gamma-HCH transport system substrate-binding protein